MAEPTLVDVARIAGVSRATAARVLAGRTNVDAGMTAAVERAAKQLGYEPNGAARMLRGGRAGSIALIVAFEDLDRLPGTILTAVLKGAAASLHAQGVQPVLLPADYDDRGRVARLLRTRAIDGAIVILQNEMTRVTQELADSPAPIAWVGRPRVALADDALVIDSDNYGGGRLAARVLADSGRRRLGIITGPHDMKPARERLRGWRDELEHLGIDYTPLAHGAFTVESGVTSMVRLLQRYPDLDGVFASSDLMAHGAIHVLKAAGRRVPTDVSVVGFDDVVIATTTDPQITTIRQPLTEMGRIAAETVVAVMHGREVDRQPIVPTNLVRRESA